MIGKQPNHVTNMEDALMAFIPGSELMRGYNIPRVRKTRTQE
jgi:hypothetical protein